MTRNVFLGADLSPAINATSLDASDRRRRGDLPRGRGRRTSPSGPFRSRRRSRRRSPTSSASRRSRTVREQIPGDGGWTGSGGIGTAAETVKYDFLELLTDELGSEVRVVDVHEEFDAELPVDLDGNNNTGTLGGEIDARLTMRDVILARKGVKTSNNEQGHFVTRYEPLIGGSIPLPVDRGWLSAEANVDGAKFKFVNSHLEAFGDPTIREAQAKELVKGPLKSKKQVVLVGDLNSGTTKRHNIGLASLGHDPNDPLAFKVFQKAEFKDNGAVQSCCYPDMFDGDVRVHAHRRPHPDQAGREDARLVRDRDRPGRADAVGALAIGPRRRGQHPAVSASEEAPASDRRPRVVSARLEEVRSRHIRRPAGDRRRRSSQSPSEERAAPASTEDPGRRVRRDARRSSSRPTAAPATRSPARAPTVSSGPTSTSCSARAPRRATSTASWPRSRTGSTAACPPGSSPAPRRKKSPTSSPAPPASSNLDRPPRA